MTDECLGWKRILLGNVNICEVPGHQQNVLLEPNVSRLAQELTTRLEAAQHTITHEARLGVVEKTARTLKQIEGMTEESVSKELRKGKAATKGS